MMPADLIWNRACEGGGRNPSIGDRALAALLKVHGLAMNGGVLHAVESLSAAELAEAESGYRFFSLGAVADLLARARKIVEADQDLESYELQLDQDYAALIPDDSALYKQFQCIYITRPAEFATI
jgi:hypothetical protein